MSYLLGLSPNKFPLALRHAWNTFETQVIPMIIKDSSRQSLHA